MVYDIPGQNMHKKYHLSMLQSPVLWSHHIYDIMTNLVMNILELRTRHKILLLEHLDQIRILEWIAIQVLHKQFAGARSEPMLILVI